MSDMFLIVVTREMLDSNPGMEDKIKEGESAWVAVVQAVHPDEMAARASNDDAQESGDDYVGTRPPTGRP